jgi:hypothetical protein
MTLATMTLVVASILHFGVAVGGVHDPYRDAAIPEAAIAAVLACGVARVATRSASAWPLAVGTTVFAILGFLVGLRFTLFAADTPRAGDVVYHVGGLALLLVTATLLLTAAGRRALRAKAMH